MAREVLKSRTKEYAHRCVKAALAVEQKGKLGKLISYQLMRSSTSVAANYRAVCMAHSTDAFAAKLSIVIEELDESAFWITFALDENLFEKNRVIELLSEAKEMLAMFIASRKTIQLKKKAKKE